MKDIGYLKERYLQDPLKTRIGNLASDFSRLEWLCTHPKESAGCEELFRQMKYFTEWIAEDKTPLDLQETMADIQIRVAMWERVWPRLGKESAFRNAVAREAHAWSNKLLKFFLLLLLVIGSAGCATIQPTVPLASVPIGVPEGVYHVVGTGETLWRISQDYGVDMHDIMQANRMTDPDRIQAGQSLIIPPSQPVRPVTPPVKAMPLDRTLERKVGVRHPLSKWRFITVHHSATRSGNATSFHRDHRRRKMGGLFYHFVIGNGTGSGDGEVEVGWRWKRQVSVNRPYDIQICLVGDFNEQEVSETQFRSLVSLVHILQNQYDVPLRHVRRHKDIPDKQTECPGRRFPFYWLLSELKALE